ncbi:hypothetical protein BHE74_00050179, partial [Ensete ventricosum]
DLLSGILEAENACRVSATFSEVTQVVIDQLTNLKREEEMLLESNKTLRRKLQEVDAENSIQLPSQIRASDCINEPPQREKFFEPLMCHPSLQIG